MPDFCQLVLMSTPSRFQERKAAFRQLVLALRKATGFIHQNPEEAKEIYRQHVGVPDDATAKSILDATLDATLPAFPNDGMMASDYYDQLMNWLVETAQVDTVAAKSTTPSVYWTNDVAW